MGFFKKLFGGEGEPAKVEKNKTTKLTAEIITQPEPSVIVDRILLGGEEALRGARSEAASALEKMPEDVRRMVDEETAVLRVKSQSAWGRFSQAIAGIRLELQGLGEFKSELMETEREIKKQDANSRAEGNKILPEAMAQVQRDKGNAEYEEILSKNYGLRDAGRAGEKIDADNWFEVGDKMDEAVAKNSAADTFADLTDAATEARAQKKEDKLVAKGTLIGAQAARRAGKQKQADAPYLEKIYQTETPAEQPLLGRKFVSDEAFFNEAEPAIKPPVVEDLTDLAEEESPKGEFDATLQSFADQVQAERAVDEFASEAQPESVDETLNNFVTRARQEKSASKPFLFSVPAPERAETPAQENKTQIKLKERENKVLKRLTGMSVRKRRNEIKKNYDTYSPELKKTITVMGWLKTPGERRTTSKAA